MTLVFSDIHIVTGGIMGSYREVGLADCLHDKCPLAPIGEHRESRVLMARIDLAGTNLQGNSGGELSADPVRDDQSAVWPPRQPLLHAACLFLPRQSRDQ